MIALTAIGYLTYPTWAPIVGLAPETGSGAAQSPSGTIAAEPAQRTSDRAEPPLTETAGGSSSAPAAAANLDDVAADTPTDAQAQRTEPVPATPEPSQSVPSQSAPQREESRAVAAATPVAQPAKPASADSFVVHVASFLDEARANHLAEDLDRRGLPTYRLDMTRSNRIWHRVYIGPFAGESTAEKIASDLKNEGVITYSRVSHR